MTDKSEIAGLVERLRIRHGDPKPTVSDLYDAADALDRLANPPPEPASDAVEREWKRIRPLLTGLISDVECAIHMNEGLDALSGEAPDEARAGVERMDTLIATLRTPAASERPADPQDGVNVATAAWLALLPSNRFNRTGDFVRITPDEAVTFARHIASLLAPRPSHHRHGIDGRGGMRPMCRRRG